MLLSEEEGPVEVWDDGLNQTRAKEEPSKETMTRHSQHWSLGGSELDLGHREEKSGMVKGSEVKLTRKRKGTLFQSLAMCRILHVVAFGAVADFWDRYYMNFIRWWRWGLERLNKVIQCDRVRLWNNWHLSLPFGSSNLSVVSYHISSLTCPGPAFSFLYFSPSGKYVEENLSL